MAERKWNSGPPPHVGWWEARTSASAPSRWGWFDGEWWSAFCSESATPEDAGTCAAMKGLYGPAVVEWTDYWPENARVPRAKP